MTIYELLDEYAEAIRDSAPVLNFCTANFNQGCLVQLDEDRENPLSSKDAPYVLIYAHPAGEDGPVADEERFRFRLVAGIAAKEDDTVNQYAPTVTTERTAAANGYRQFGTGELAETLLRLALDACKAVALDDAQMKAAEIEVEGILWFPLQLAGVTVTVEAAKDLATFD